MKPAAFRATYSDLKLIKTRQCVQIVFELPLADFDAAYNILGGMPNPANETWFGIAPLVAPNSETEVMSHPKRSPGHHNAQPQPNQPPAGAKREWRDVDPTTQAGIRCNEAIFAAYLKENFQDDWHESQDAAGCVRLICGVQSRKLLSTDQRARVLWHQLDSQFAAWKALEHA